MSTEPNTFPVQLNFEIDSSLTDITFPLAETILKAVRDKGIEGVSIFFLFYDSVKCVEEAFKISGRLYGPQVALGHGNYIKYKNLEFRVEHRIRWFGQTGKRAGAQLEIKLMSNSLSIGSVRELIQFLFEREVLFITD